MNDSDIGKKAERASQGLSTGKDQYDDEMGSRRVHSAGQPRHALLTPKQTTKKSSRSPTGSHRSFPLALPTLPISLRVNLITLCVQPKRILDDISHTPVTHGDLHEEGDIFDAIKQLLAWKPPPTWKRDRSRCSTSYFESRLFQTTKKYACFENQAAVRSIPAGCVVFV